MHKDSNWINCSGKRNSTTSINIEKPLTHILKYNAKLCSFLLMLHIFPLYFFCLDVKWVLSHSTRGHARTPMFLFVNVTTVSKNEKWRDIWRFRLIRVLVWFYIYRSRFTGSRFCICVCLCKMSIETIKTEWFRLQTI